MPIGWPVVVSVTLRTGEHIAVGIVCSLLAVLASHIHSDPVVELKPMPPPAPIIAQLVDVDLEAACGRDVLAQAGDLSEGMFHGVEMSVPLAIVVARGSGFEDREKFRDRSVRSRR